MLMKTFFVLCCAALFIIQACSSPELKDGYQFGDLRRIHHRRFVLIKRYRDDYCDAYADNLTRRVALSGIRLYFPAYPADGICTRLIESLVVVRKGKT